MTLLKRRSGSVKVRGHRSDVNISLKLLQNDSAGFVRNFFNVKTPVFYHCLVSIDRIALSFETNRTAFSPRSCRVILIRIF